MGSFRGRGAIGKPVAKPKRTASGSLAVQIEADAAADEPAESMDTESDEEQDGHAVEGELVVIDA